MSKRRVAGKRAAPEVAGEVSREVPREVPKRFEKRPSAPDVDPTLVDQTKNQIRELVSEIAQLAKSDCTVEDFYEGFLTRTTSALASVGGAIWVRESGEAPLRLHYHINLKQTKLAQDQKAQAKHGRLLRKLADGGEPRLVSPHSGGTATLDSELGASDLPGNPTEYLLVTGPLKIDNETVGIVEIFQRPGAGPTTQRGYLRFLMQMCDIASDFLRNQRIRSFAAQQAMWQQLEQYIRLVHRGLDSEETVYTIANEGRRLIDCDRVSVAVGVGRSCRVKAVSGLDSIERRSEQVKQLSGLAAAVIRTGQPLWYAGDDKQLPPQLEKKLHQYIDKSHTKMLAILPLVTPPQESAAADQSAKTLSSKSAALGAVIVEQLKDARITPALEKRAEIVVAHGQAALTNAAEHNRIFLLPLWKTLGSLTSTMQGAGRWKLVLASTLAVVATAFLTLFPASFGLSANGSLVPESRQEIFAQIDGTMAEIFVSDDGDTLVQPNQVLARMTNSDLQITIEQLTSQIEQQSETIRSSQAIRSRENLTPLEQVELSGKIETAITTRDGLKNELEIRLLDLRRLEVTSPIAGRVVNWNARQNLLHRPVTKGQNLMTVIPPTTRWLIELEMPERRLAHLLRAAEENERPLQVTFGLVSNPGTEYVGEIIDIDRRLDVYSDDGNSALIRVAFPNEEIAQDLLRSETRVTGKVECGTRSIGYVLFHELIETVQSKWQLWF